MAETRVATCYQRHPFEIDTEDRLTTINTKIFEIKKKIQLSEGQRKSIYEENEAEKQQNNDLIDTLKKELKIRLQELAAARILIGDEEATVRKYLHEVSPVGSKSTDQVIHNLDLKVTEQRKTLDLLKYEKKSKKTKLKDLERDYECLLIENSKSATEKLKYSKNPAKKHASYLENEIHKVLVQWSEAELVKKKYFSIRKSLLEDSVKFESSLDHISELLQKQQQEIAKLEQVKEEAAEMRLRATAALVAATARAQDSEASRAAERSYFAQRFEERRRELEKLEKRIFPPPARTATVLRQDSSGSTEGGAATEEVNAAAEMEEVFQRLMKLTGVTEPEEVFDRFRAQRETCKRLSYLQQSTEEEKLELESTQTALMAELDAFKFAAVKDKDEGSDKINDLKEEIKAEEDNVAKLEAELVEVERELTEIKKLLYELCKLLDVSPDPPMPEWTVEARDVQQIIQVLRARYEKAAARADEVRNRRGDVTPVLPSNPPSGAASGVGVSVQTTPREAEAPVPTYKELLQKEPVKPLASDEEDDIPSRSYLKRQAQLIIDTKSRRKGFRPPYPKR